MSYIQVDIGGVQRGLKFNQAANEIFWRTIQSNPDSQTHQVYSMFYAGLRGNSIAKGTEPDYTFEQVQDWVDELYLSDAGTEMIQKVDAVFTETQQYRHTLDAVMKLIEKASPEKGKKKALRKSGMKSTS